MTYPLPPLSAATTTMRRRAQMGRLLGVTSDNQAILNAAYHAAVALEAAVYRAKDQKFLAAWRAQKRGD